MRKFFSFIFFLLLSMVVFMLPVTAVASGGDRGCVIVDSMVIADSQTILQSANINFINLAAMPIYKNVAQVPGEYANTEVIRYDHSIVRIGTAPIDHILININKLV